MFGPRECGSARRPAAVLVACLALALSLALPAGSAADDIAWMFDPDAVVEVHLDGLSEAELDALEADPDEYQKGTFELKVDGVTKGAPLVDVGIRRKGGFGSVRPIKTGKSGLKVRFDEFVDDQLFFGIKRLTLNNMFQDESMVHETLTYELFDAVGLPASRTGYAFVTLNGEKYGVMLNLETLDEISLPRWFPTTGHLYEADESQVDVKPGGAGDFEVDEGDEEDLSDLEALIAAANDESGDWSDGMEAVADLQQMAAHWAVERYVAHWDGYAGAAGTFRPNNYYLHSDASGVFQMVPWGTDQTWESGALEFKDPAGGLMFNKCLEDDTCKELYVEGLTEIHCVNQTTDHAARAGELAAMLDPHQDEEDEARRGYTAEQIAEEVEDVEGFARFRVEQLTEYLTAEGVLGGEGDPCAPPTPEPEPPVVPPGPVDSPSGAAGVTVDADALPSPPVWIGASRVRGAFVATRLVVPAAGMAIQRVTSWLGGRRVRVCSGRVGRAAAGPLEVRCAIRRAVRRALDAGSLRFRVRVGFVPTSGGVRSFEIRHLSVGSAADSLRAGMAHGLR
ncbi:MAG TPA: CotH kinase family protein [Solirubrobacterales bacterium]|nr:CotH kinase family protein [Solirubrobacterales bacterium]